jgi:hypothetical protein
MVARLADDEYITVIPESSAKKILEKFTEEFEDKTYDKDLSVENIESFKTKYNSGEHEIDPEEEELDRELAQLKRQRLRNNKKIESLTEGDDAFLYDEDD